MKKKLLSCLEWLKNVFSKKKIKAFLSDKKNRRSVITLCSVAVILIATVIFAVVYINDYYHVDGQALIEYTESSANDININIKTDKDDIIAVIPNEVKAGFIFYPGGKVEFNSYLPLMLECAERGILCVLIKMPCNLAVLNANAADGITEDYPEVTEWYIGGHSLGGSMAASYLSKHSDEISGLILLGSYSTADVTDSRVLSIYGSEDGVMNREKYEKYSSNLPSNFTEIIIDGGNHAYFGIYGKQDGDGSAKITQKEQIKLTAEYIANFIFDKD